MGEINIFKSSIGAINKALSLEWLDTNGVGGYSSSTIINSHTRKYHGWMVVELRHPPGKFVLLSKVDDSLLVDSMEFSLTTNQFPGFFDERVYSFFSAYHHSTHPSFTYQFEDSTLRKEILFLQGEDVLLVKYHLNSKKMINNAQIRMRPFIAYRSFHALSKENNQLNTHIEHCKRGIQLSPYPDMPTLYIQTEPMLSYSESSYWYKNFEYLEEQKRGFDFREDLYTPGIITLDFNENNEAIFSCAISEQDNLFDRWNKELCSRAIFLKQCNINSESSHACRSLAVDDIHIICSSLKNTLIHTGKQFLINKGEKKASVIAGYHWFLEWGRDAMISLPGLTLYSGFEDEFLSVMQYYADREKQGVIPNYIDTDEQKNAYNTIDASLWFAWAVQQYYLKTNNLEAIEHKLWPTLKNIFTSYREGTVPNSVQQENGLIDVSNPLANLTWMDAVVNQLPVTPRLGFQVEVNALWYNMLQFMSILSQQLDDPLKNVLPDICDKVNKSFQKVFWDDKGGYLYDFVNNHETNQAIRPNQIIAVSLPFSPVNKKMAKSIVNTVHKHLLTPCGLRTLSPEDKQYIGRYTGDSVARDSAYHQGTVWPWLLCHFGEALLKVTTKQQVMKILKPCIVRLNEHVNHEACLGGVSEIFDGDLPHDPNGCINQAWSVAEWIRLLRVLE